MKCLLVWTIVIASLPSAWADAPPAPWSDADIGTVGSAGGTVYTPSGGIFSVKGSGADIYGTADGFHFLSQGRAGDFTFVARITSAGGTNVNSGAASGIMVRETLGAGSRHVLLYLEPGGYARTVVRTATGSASLRFGIGAQGYPQWLRLRRCGEQISTAFSADGTTWTAGPGQTLPGLAATAYVGLATTARNNAAVNTAVFDHVTLGALDVETATSWLGNSYGGGRRYVQYCAQAIAVDPATGNVFVNGVSESYSTTFYDTNGNFLACGLNSHFNGSNAIAWDPTNHCVWAGQSPYNGTTGKGGAASYTVDGNATGSILNTSTGGQTLAGLAVLGSSLYAVDTVNVATPSDTAHVTVHVVSLSSKTETGSFLVPAGARNLAADNAGYLWIVFPANGPTAAVVRRYSSAGVLQAQQITGLGNPQGIAADAAGNLYVADTVPDQQIKVYNTSGILLRRLGDLHGIYSGTSGRVSPTKLDHPVGVAVDTAGNLYVSCNGPAGVWANGSSGLMLRKYTSTTALSAATLAWERDGLEYVDCPAADPATDGVDLYTKHHHYVMDYGKPPGQGWTYVGELLDDQAYPADPRLTSARSGVWLRTIGGKKFLVDNDQQGGQINFYRFQSGSEITVPYATFVRETARGAATNALSIWVDGNLNGAADAGEADTAGQPLGAPSNEVYGWYVDAGGDVWTMGGQNNTVGGVRQAAKIWHFKAAVGGNGCPVYSSANCESFALPAKFTGTNACVVRVLYVPATDTLYVSGYSAALPKPDTRFGLCGTELARYDHWRSSGGAAAPTWSVTLPYTAADGVRSLDVAGGIVAAVTWGSHQVTVYDAATGALLDTLSPGPEVAGVSGNIDTQNGIAVHPRANGEYLIFVEEDNEQKVMMYRWNPWTDATIGSPASGSGSSDAASGTFTVTGMGAGPRGATDALHFVCRGMTGDGQIVARLGAVASSQLNACGGIMIRDSLASGAMFASAVGTTASNDRRYFMYRAATGGTAGQAAAVASLPVWYKLVRSGNSFSAYQGTDGTSWTMLGATQTIPMGTETYVGFPVWTNSNSITATATLDHVTATP